jgi:hypothetical protein
MHAREAQFSQIQRIDKRINHANRIALIDEIIEHSGNSVDCVRSAPATKRLIDPPAESPRRIIATVTFSHIHGQVRTLLDVARHGLIARALEAIAMTTMH